jgi:AraC-like DNA-binding protein
MNSGNPIWKSTFIKLDCVSNTTLGLDFCFSKMKKEIEPLLFNLDSMSERISVTEKFLIRHFYAEKYSAPVMQAVNEILCRRGNIRIEQLTADMHISSRQLERLFLSRMGISPKKFASLVRYQYVWNDVLFRPGFNIQDEVYESGYSDQAHLLHEFKKYHSMTIIEAEKYARRDVAFLQAGKSTSC